MGAVSNSIALRLMRRRVKLGNARHRATAVAAGADFCCVISTDGQLLNWGRSEKGRLGRPKRPRPSEHISEVCLQT